MKKIHLLLLSALSGVLFTLSWPVNGLPAFLFTALVPMLIIEQYIAEHSEKFNRYSVFFYTYPGFFIWNVATTYWVFNSTPVAVLAWVFNSMFMSFVFNVFHLSRRHIYGKHKGYFLLVIFWVAFEYVHLSWKLTWPWLTLGNGFGVYPKWIQWYEYTGALGGSIWVIMANILFFRAISNSTIEQLFSKKILVKLLIPLLMILIPVFISYLIYFSYKEDSNPVEVIITQPNIDPYSEQYSLPPIEVINRNMKLAEPLRSENTRFIVAPESALQEDIWERNLQWSTSLKMLQDYIRHRPGIEIVIGASTYTKLREGEKIPGSARYHDRGEFYYNRHNTAFLVDTTNDFQRHHKSKLTPGVEWMPSWGPFRFFESLAIDLGGTVGSLGIDEDQTPFVTQDSLVIAPLICYESVYGEFTSNFIRNGAEVIFIITNDGWWGNTPGHKQHAYFAPIRAIENRRSIARSANTGISCFVNQRGDISQETNYWEPIAIKEEINLNSKLTFYTSMGEYIGRIVSFLSVLFILMAIVFQIRNRKRV
ncbi:MAG: apolipoprotein N-acyltransferase [Bacteroidales bacterium]|nr:apolipoprotein N-acyltransferase [Bacteroidales bacterium]MCF8402667.1 apolipoprotein N-acyltransferase [Bacteroidales bacterium]